MKFIRAALRYDADLPAGAPPEFRGRNAGLYGELLHGIRDPKIPQCRIDLRIDVAHAVKQEIVRLRARTRDVETTTLCPGG